MKVELKKMTVADLLALNEKNNSRPEVRKVTEAQAKWIENTAHSFSLYIEDKLVACGGAIQYWKNRAEAWAVLDPDCKKYFLTITHETRKFLDRCPFVRIEASVDVTFEAGHRWVKTLGFKLEAERLRHFLSDGQDAALYARIKEVPSV